MTTLRMTDHALLRLAQRGIACSDADLILELGSEVEDGYLVRACDCQQIERSIKTLLTRVHRLKGKRIVTAGGSLVTAYHASRRQERRLLRTMPCSDRRLTLPLPRCRASSKEAGIGYGPG